MGSPASQRHLVPCKQSKFKVAEVSVNDGIHMHEIMVVPKETRLKEPLDLHFLRNRKLCIAFTLNQLLREPRLSPTTGQKYQEKTLLDGSRFSSSENSCRATYQNL
jgi:hypothetical protein